MANKHVLLVEDNPDDELLTTRVLKKSPFLCDVEVARDGVEALQFLQKRGHAPFPDLVLLDLKLPKVNGLEVLKSIRENEETRLLPVVVFTSSNEGQDITRVYELCGNSYVRKPVDFKDFTTTVELICDYWLGQNLTTAA